MPNSFSATRAEAVRRLHAFVPVAGRHYTAGRNTDNGPGGHAHVSLLSPYLRHRLITEREVIQAVLAKHGLLAAEKYIQEVLWRTYWKGWLEMRPTIWTRFLNERDQMRESFLDGGAVAAAETGMTGLDGFDDWARELVETGYLHNHARMWFASIWIFTLRLPWALGADFFLRHLIDADPASNTLSWRWVAGLQTVGKTYLATADNIAKYTGGRFAPKGLAVTAQAMIEAPIPQALPLMAMPHYDDKVAALLLVTPEDMNPETLLKRTASIKAVVIVPGQNEGKQSAAFAKAAGADTATRVSAYFGCKSHIADAIDLESILAIAGRANVKHIITPYAAVGPTADALKALQGGFDKAGVGFCQIQRSWDTHFWPHAQKGFFAFKEKIAETLKSERL